MEINKEYVDLGLPRGLLWAKCNLGANKPEEPGLYFQWGDVQGKFPVKIINEDEITEPKDELFDWKASLKHIDNAKIYNYKFYIRNTAENKPILTKYNNEDRKTVLEREDDAVHILMGSNWRLPTHEDFYELVTNTDMFLVPTEGDEISLSMDRDGGLTIETYFKFDSETSTCKGMKFYKKGDHSVFLFVPMTGDFHDGIVNNADSVCRLWSSSVSTSYPHFAWNFSFSTKYPYLGVSTVFRFFESPLRGVLPKE